MAERGLEQRQQVNDQNMQSGRENPNKIHMPTAPIRSPRMPSGGSTGGGTNLGNMFSGIFEKYQERKTKTDFLQGQMAYVQGQVEADVAGTGNKTQMAGFMSLKAGVATETWLQQEMDYVNGEGSSLSPEAYQQRLHESAATMLASAGDDEYTQQIIMKGVEKAFMSLTAAQTRANKAYTLEQTNTEYRNTLLKVSDNQDATDQVTTTGTPSPYYTARSYTPQDSMINAIIQIESGGDPNAKNPLSSAAGLGQFIDDTWLSTLKKHRPDIYNSMKPEELLKLKYDPNLSREMVGAYISDNAAILAKSGVALTAGTAYLAHFAGPGGAIRIMKGNRSAHVSTVMTQKQINANPFLAKWTVGQVQDWAARKMQKNAGKYQPPEQRAAPVEGQVGPPEVTITVEDLVRNNHGLPQDKHVATVVDTMIYQMQGGSAALFEKAGGLDTLAEMGATTAQLRMVQQQHAAYLNKKETEYNTEKQNELAAIEAYVRETGDLEGGLEKLNTADQKYGISDGVMHKMDAALRGIEDDKNDPLMSPAIRADLYELNQQVGAGVVDLEAGLEQIAELAEKEGFTKEQTVRAYDDLERARVSYDNARKTNLKKQQQEYEKARVLAQKAATAISSNSLSTEDKKTQEAGIELIHQSVAQQVLSEGVGNVTGPAGQPVQDTDMIKGEMSRRIAKVTVQNDVVDHIAARQMVGALNEPLRIVDGQARLTQEQIEAYSHYLELKRAGASEEYLGRMFKGQDDTLALLSIAETLDAGDMDTTSAFLRARQIVENTDMEAHRASVDAKMSMGIVERSVDRVLAEAAADPSMWDAITGKAATRGTEFLSTTTTAQELERYRNDPNLRAALQENMRRNLMAHPGMSADAAITMAMRQTVANGDFVMGGYIPAGVNGTISDQLGVGTQGMVNQLVMDYLAANGESYYGKDAWAAHIERNHYVLDELGYGFKKVIGTIGQPFTGSTAEEVETWASPKATRAESARRVPHAYVEYDPVGQFLIVVPQERTEDNKFIPSQDVPMIITMQDLAKQRDITLAPKR